MKPDGQIRVISIVVISGLSIQGHGGIDGHDECEWVNVSSGTGSPGLSRTNSTEP